MTLSPDHKQTFTEKYNIGVGQVRAIKSPDFAEIQEIASRAAGFTVPSKYVLWMLAEMYPSSSLVVGSTTKNCILAYCLSLPAPDYLFVWQFGVLGAKPRPSSTAHLLLHTLIINAISGGFNELRFTLRPNSASFRYIHLLLEMCKLPRAELIADIPPLVWEGQRVETLFKLNISDYDP